MTKNAIQIRNISKQYRIPEVKQSYVSLRESIMNFLTFKKNNYNDFWALKDINFDIKKGDSFAIMGKNGAGKSTLLKLISRVTIPTEGEIKIQGTIASLLEVGVGFHPELTGRENIYLNGSMLGMKKIEISNKIQSIIDFSEINEFIDMQVKHYSTGMYMRLAFSIAIHVDSDILIVDEALSVGDIDFQTKCIEKIKSYSLNPNKTVLFVSHDVSILSKLCNKGAVFKNGQLVKSGSIQECMLAYTDFTRDKLYESSG